MSLLTSLSLRKFASTATATSSVVRMMMAAPRPGVTVARTTTSAFFFSSSSSSCPFTGTSGTTTGSAVTAGTASVDSTATRSKSTVAAAAGAIPEQHTHEQHPTLVEIPSVPLFGSMISAISGLKVDPTDFVGSWRKWTDDYGPFYSLGVPGLGSGSHGTAYVTTDPDQLHKVLKQEGSFPAGLVEGQWLFKEWAKRRNYKCIGFYGRYVRGRRIGGDETRRDEQTTANAKLNVSVFLAFLPSLVPLAIPSVSFPSSGSGPEWKRVRNFMQKDLLAPQSAREYLPAMLRAAAKASPRASAWAEQNQIQRFLNFCAMDLFNGIHFGDHTEMSDDDYEEFCVAAVDGLGQGVALNRDPWTRLAMTLGITTSATSKVFANLDKVHEISQRRQKQVLDRLESGHLTDLDRESYFYKSLQRQDDSDLSLDEMLEIGVMIMMASVDTTSGKTAWNLLQLAVNPDVQDKLRSEILIAMEQEGGLTPAVMDLPYLKAFIRETHRCTPVGPVAISKELTVPTEVHGMELPAGSVVCLASNIQLNPEYVEDPLEFRPERWLPDAVQARKNTKAAAIDHPFFSGPFSQGARRCPGSRVAYLEIQVMLAQLLLDWDIQAPSHVKWTDVPSTLETMVVPVFPEGTRFVPRNA